MMERPLCQYTIGIKSALLCDILTEVHEDLCYLGTGGPGGRRQGVVPLAGQQTGVHRPVHGLHGIAGDGGGVQIALCPLAALAGLVPRSGP